METSRPISLCQKLREGLSQQSSEQVDLAIERISRVALDEFGNTPLHIAIDSGPSDLADQVISRLYHHRKWYQRGVRPPLQAPNNWSGVAASRTFARLGPSGNIREETPLHLACSSTYRRIISLLLQNDNVSHLVRDRSGHSPLIRGLLAGQRKLLPLFDASRPGSVEESLEDFAESSELRDWLAMSPHDKELIWRTKLLNARKVDSAPQAMQLLLQRKRIPQVPEGIQLWLQEQTPLAPWLMESPTRRDYRHRKTVIAAFQALDIPALMVALKRTGKFNLLPSEVQDQLWELLKEQEVSTDFLQWLFSRRVLSADSPKARLGWFGENALFTALHGGLRKQAMRMIRAGCPHSQPGPGGSTALHYAASTGDHELLRLLIQSGASPRVLDYKRRTPLHLALDLEDSVAAERLSKRLLDAGALPSTRDDTGRTPFSMVRERNLQETLNLLNELSDQRLDELASSDSLLADACGRQPRVLRASSSSLSSPLGITTDKNGQIEIFYQDPESDTLLTVPVAYQEGNLETVLMDTVLQSVIYPQSRIFRNAYGQELKDEDSFFEHDAEGKRLYIHKINPWTQEGNTGSVLYAQVWREEGIQGVIKAVRSSLNDPVIAEIAAAYHTDDYAAVMEALGKPLKEPVMKASPSKELRKNLSVQLRSSQASELAVGQRLMDTLRPLFRPTSATPETKQLETDRLACSDRMKLSELPEEFQAWLVERLDPSNSKTFREHTALLFERGVSFHRDALVHKVLQHGDLELIRSVNIQAIFQEELAQVGLIESPMLNVAAERQDPAIVEHLLGASLDHLQIPDANGRTPLLRAVLSNKRSLFEFLVQQLIARRAFDCSEVNYDSQGALKVSFTLNLDFAKQRFSVSYQHPITGERTSKRLDSFSFDALRETVGQAELYCSTSKEITKALRLPLRRVKRAPELHTPGSGREALYRITMDKHDVFLYLPSRRSLLGSNYWVTLSAPLAAEGLKELPARIRLARKAIYEHRITARAIKATPSNTPGIQLPPAPDVNIQWPMEFFNKMTRGKTQIVRHGQRSPVGPARESLQSYINTCNRMPEYRHIVKILQDHPDDEFKFRHVVSLATAGAHCSWRTSNQTTDTYRELTDQWNFEDLDTQILFWLSQFKLACLYTAAGRERGSESTNEPTIYSEVVQRAGLGLAKLPGLTTGRIRDGYKLPKFLNVFNPVTLVKYMSTKFNEVLAPSESESSDKAWIEMSNQIRNRLLTYVENYGLDQKSREYLEALQIEHVGQLSVRAGKPQAIEEENKHYASRKHDLIEARMEDLNLIEWDNDYVSFTVTPNAALALLVNAGILEAC